MNRLWRRRECSGARVWDAAWARTAVAIAFGKKRIPAVSHWESFCESVPVLIIVCPCVLPMMWCPCTLLWWLSGAEGSWFAGHVAVLLLKHFCCLCHASQSRTVMCLNPELWCVSIDVLVARVCFYVFIVDLSCFIASGFCFIHCIGCHIVGCWFLFMFSVFL